MLDSVERGWLVTNRPSVGPSRSKLDALAVSALGDSMVVMKDVAKACGVTYRTVQNWRMCGVLPPPDFVLGKVLRWRRETIEHFIRTRSGGAS